MYYPKDSAHSPNGLAESPLKILCVKKYVSRTKKIIFFLSHYLIGRC